MRIIGFHIDGGFSEYVKVPAANLIPLPDGMSVSAAALAEPLGCATRQMRTIGAPDWNEGGGRPKIFIAGCGALGVLTAMLWSERGARVTAADARPDKIRKAAPVLEAFGVRAAPISELGAVEAGFDFAIACCPGGDGFALCVRSLKKGGRMGFFSGVTFPMPDERAFNELHYKEIQLSGAYGCALSDTREAVGVLSGWGGILDALTRTVSLEDAAGVVSRDETEDIFTQIAF
jgi:L-iditol 2-dehydrogenase